MARRAGAPRRSGSAFWRAPAKLALLSALATPVLAGRDFYAILGVGKKAKADELKSAYRKLSLENHPDKCAEEKKKECEAAFIDISTAYEVLNDPDKKKVYDQKGEDGLNEKGGDQEGSAQMFRQFFGREPRGKVTIQRGPGGQMYFNEEEEPGPKENLFEDKDGLIELTSTTFKAFVEQRDEPWFVLFYKPNDEDSQKMQKDFKEVGKTYEGICKVGAVNCYKEASLCRGASVESFPSMRWYPPEASKDPEIAATDTTAKAIGKFISGELQDFSTHVENKDDLRKWLDNAVGPAAILYTDKKTVPPMWKALSRVTKDRASLAVRLRCDKSGVFKSPLESEYDVRIPSILLMDPLGAKVVEKYGSQMKMSVLEMWFLKWISKGKQAGPKATFKEWTPELLAEGSCAPADSQFCFVWLKAGKNAGLEAAMMQVATKYRRDPIKLVWVNVEKYMTVLDTFGFGEDFDGEDKLVAYRPKRKTLKVFEGEFDFKSLDAFVDGVMNGGALPAKIVGQLKLEL